MIIKKNAIGLKILLLLFNSKAHKNININAYSPAFVWVQYFHNILFCSILQLASPPVIVHHQVPGVCVSKTVPCCPVLPSLTRSLARASEGARA